MVRTPELRVTLVGHYPPPYGGVATLLVDMEAALAAAGCTLSVFNLSGGRASGERVRNFDRGNRVRQVLELRRAFASEDADVFHCVSASYRSFWMAALCLALAKAARKRMVLSFVGGAFPAFLRSLDPIRAVLARAVLARADALIPCSGDIAAVLEEFAPGRVGPVVTNAFRAVAAPAGPLPAEVLHFVRGHEPVVCTTAGPAPEYGLLGALDAVARLRGKHPRIGFVLVLTRYGNAEHEREVSARIGTLGLRDHVLVTRDLPDFLALLGAADAFLRSTLVDGDSMSVREALAVGVPVAASDTPFRPEGVVLFRRGDAEDMARALEECLEVKREAGGGAAAGRVPSAPGPRGRGAGASDETGTNLATLLSVYRTVVESGPRRGR